MRKVIYSMGVSLDGFIAGPDGSIDWAAPDEELHRFHNEQAREVGVHVNGRRLYEGMIPWEQADADPNRAEHEREFARIWKARPKVVFSTTLLVSPVVVGGGTLFFPPTQDRVDLRLLETRTFGTRVVYARYERV